MNCRGCRQRFLPLPDLSRKIEGGLVCRVPQHLLSTALQSIPSLAQEESKLVTRGLKYRNTLTK